MAVASEAVTPFADVWQTVQETFGWLEYGEASVLYQAALRVPEDGVIVEIGSFAGKSARLLAATGRRVLCVDPLEIGVSVGKIKICDAIVESMQRAADLPNISWQRVKSDAAKYPPRIDMAYIDACHKYPHPLNDFSIVEAMLYPGAIVAFHDYHREHGVTRTVIELEQLEKIRLTAVAESMYIGVML